MLVCFGPRSVDRTVPKVLGMGPEVEDSTFAGSTGTPDGLAEVGSFVRCRNHDRPARANFARVQNAHEVLDLFLVAQKVCYFLQIIVALTPSFDSFPLSV